MDNDLALAVFPPALIQSIKDKLNTTLKEKGYILEVNEEELNEKTYLLSVSKSDGLTGEKYIFIPKQNQDNTWINGYLKDSYRKVNGDGYTDNEIPIFKLVGPKTKISYNTIDVPWLVKRIIQYRSWGDVVNPFDMFLNSLPFSDDLSEEKIQEVFEYTKDYVKNRYEGYVDTSSTKLEVGDYVRWERKTRSDRNRYGRYRQGEIVRQTPSGFFVVNVDGEDKPARFKPDYGKYMGKRFKGSELPDDFWEPTEREG